MTGISCERNGVRRCGRRIEVELDIADNDDNGGRRECGGIEEKDEEQMKKVRMVQLAYPVFICEKNNLLFAR